MIYCLARVSCASLCEVFLSYVWYIFFFFFFSSRRRHTRCSRDWSSDVCSSDLAHVARAGAQHREALRLQQHAAWSPGGDVGPESGLHAQECPPGKAVAGDGGGGERGVGGKRGDLGGGRII